MGAKKKTFIKQNKTFDCETSLLLPGSRFLERKQLLCPVVLVMDVGRRFNQVKQVRPCEKIAQVYEFAVVLVLDCLEGNL